MIDKKIGISINIAICIRMFLLVLASVGNVHTSRGSKKENIFVRPLLRPQKTQEI
jgi:hypothetical protein